MRHLRSSGTLPLPSQTLGRNAFGSHGDAGLSSTAPAQARDGRGARMVADRRQRRGRPALTAFRLGIRDLAIYRDLQGPVCAVDDARRRAAPRRRCVRQRRRPVPGPRDRGSGRHTTARVGASDSSTRTSDQTASTLFNNAAATDILWVGPGRRDGPATEVQTDACEQILRGGVTGALWACRYAIPAMAAGRGGSIISISTAAASRAARGLAGHSASRPRSRRSRDRWLSTLRRRASAPTHSASASSPTAADTRRCWRTRRWCRPCAIGS